MVLLTILIICIAFAVIALSLIRSGQIAVSPSRRITLIVLRIMLVLLALLAFIEPSCVVERFPETTRVIPVLIDNSRSMNVLKENHHLMRLIDSISTRYPSALYLFGDSLRPPGKNETPAFSDKRSFFPESLRDRQIAKAPKLFIISDGHWSNARIPDDFLSDKTIHYLILPSATPHPSLAVSIAKPPLLIPQNKPGEVNAQCSGYCPEDDTIRHTLFRDGIQLSTRTYPVRAGNFNLTLTTAIPGEEPGRRLYRLQTQLLRAKSTAGHLRSTVHFSPTVIPRQFTYKIAASAPSLNRRFLKLAFVHFDTILPPNSTSDHTDLLFILEWNDSSRMELQKLKQTGIAIFMGCLPSATTIKTPIRQGRLIHSPIQNRTLHFLNLPLEDLPPPPSISTGDLSGFIPTDTMLSLVNEQTMGKPDTTDLLVSGHWQGRQILICRASEFWQWDFWPLNQESSIEKEFSFSTRIIATAVDLAHQSLSRRFLVYPSRPASENDSLMFSVILPSDLGFPVNGTLQCAISAQGSKITDTTIETVFIGNDRTTFALKPLAQGEYHLRATAKTIDRSFTFEDTVFINDDHSEYTASGQNTTLLGELGQAVSINELQDGNALDTLLLPQKNTPVLPEKELLHLPRGWVLLLLFFAVFGVEMVLRRKWGTLS